MKNATIQIRYDCDQLDALTMFLTEKGLTVEGELSDFLDQLLEKHVPKQVVNYLLNRPVRAPRPRPIKREKPAAGE